MSLFLLPGVIWLGVSPGRHTDRCCRRASQISRCTDLGPRVAENIINTIQRFSQLSTLSQALGAGNSQETLSSAEQDLLAAWNRLTLEQIRRTGTEVSDMRGSIRRFRQGQEASTEAQTRALQDVLRSTNGNHSEVMGQLGIIRGMVDLSEESKATEGKFGHSGYLTRAPPLRV